MARGKEADKTTQLQTCVPFKIKMILRTEPRDEGRAMDEGKVMGSEGGATSYERFFPDLETYIGLPT